MPVIRCQAEGREGWKFGPSGVCFLGPDAKERAARVGRAISARRGDQGVEGAVPPPTIPPPGILPPDAAEDDYRILLQQRIAELHREIDRAVKGVIGTATISATLAGRGRALIRAIEDAQRKFEAGQSTATLQREVEAIASEVDGFTTRRLADVLEPGPRPLTEGGAEEAVALLGGLALLGLGAAAALRPGEPITPGFAAGGAATLRAGAGAITVEHMQWARENVRLIGGLEAAHVEEITKMVTEIVESGGSEADLVAGLQKRLGVSERRAKNMARNEVGNLNATVTKQRQESLGVSQFIWQTMEDDRVREEHATINGQTFDWATGAPVEGSLPGVDYGCRCVALPAV